MKTVKKNVYYCDYCNKRSLSASHTSKHEKHCTANPHRECRMCEGNNDIDKIVKELKKSYKLNEKADEFGEIVIKAEWINEPVTLAYIEGLVNSCPNCMLAIIRQCKFGYHYFKEIGFESFNYKTAMTDAMNEKNSLNEEYEWQF